MTAGGENGPVPQTSVLLRAGGAGLGGVLLALAFPPFDAWPLAVLGVAAIVAATFGAGARRGAWLGLLAGLTFFGVLLQWLDVIGIDAWLGLAVVQAAFWLLLGAGFGLVTRLSWWPLWVIGMWVGVEVLRSTVPLGGFPWGRLGYGATTSPLLSYAWLAGPVGVAVAVLICAVALVGLVRASLDRDVRRAVAACAVLGTTLLVAVLLPVSVEREADEDLPTVQAAIVQGNVPEPGLDFTGERREVLSNHTEATHELAAEVRAGQRPQPQLVLWPENSSDIDPYQDSAAFAQIDAAVRDVDAPTLVGAVVETQDPNFVENSGIVWDPDTGPGERYVKRHPIPFGEYIPFRSTIAPIFERFDRIPRDFVAGDEPGVLQLGPALIGDVICFEVAYDDVVADVVNGGAQVLVVQTNNATYGLTGQPEQQFAISRLRAVEHGRTVLVASTSGISGVIAPTGEVLAQTEQFVAETISTEVALRDARTPATRLGPWPALVSLGVGVLGVALAVRRSRHSAPTPADVTTDERHA